jgi:mannose-6-phosphate isomerase-like protein (cupin superfamily)
MRATILGPGEGETLSIGPTTAVFKATSEATGGGFSLSETTLAPGVPGPPPHTHRQMVDSFYVLEGTLTVRLGDDELEAGAGTYVCVPPGIVHTFRNPTDAPVRILNLNSPGGWEGYMRDLAAAMPASGPPSADAIADLAARHDFEPVLGR